MKHPHFYAVIIGTEILNGRREDKHFAFVRSALQRRGYPLYASLTIKDDAVLIARIFRLVREDPNAVLLSFGGIGSTPDDLTRPIAAEVFTGRPLQRHKRFEQDIIERFGEEAFPHRIHMADLPEGAGLLKNPVNNMSGFHLRERYFFVPGFPDMAHPMISEALERFFPPVSAGIRRTLIAETSENTLIDIMKTLPEGIELSSLPKLKNGFPSVEISVAGRDDAAVAESFGRFTAFLEAHKIAYDVV